MNVEIQTQSQRRESLPAAALHGLGKPRLLIANRPAATLADRYSPSVQGRQQRAVIGRLDVLKRGAGVDIQANHCNGATGAFEPWPAVQDKAGAAPQQNKLVCRHMAASGPSSRYGCRPSESGAVSLQAMEAGKLKTESDPRLMDTYRPLQPRSSGVKNCYVSNYQGYVGCFSGSMCPIFVHLSRNTIYRGRNVNTEQRHKQEHDIDFLLKGCV